MENKIEATAKGGEEPGSGIEPAVAAQCWKPEDRPNTIDAKAAANAACTIYKALQNSDAQQIREVLEPANAASRKLIEDSYEKQFGHKFSNEFLSRFAPDSDEFIMLQSIMNRRDGQSDEAGQIRLALNKVHAAAQRLSSEAGGLTSVLPTLIIDTVQGKDTPKEKAAAEADIRRTIGDLTSAQLQELKRNYKQNYNADLEETLLSNKDLSKESKDSLKILLKGCDKRMGSDKESIENVMDLAQIGLRTRNISLLEESLQNASPEARRHFRETGGMRKIYEQFSGEDQELAESYAYRGRTNLAVLLEGKGSDKDEIKRLLNTVASDSDRAEYLHGKELGIRSNSRHFALLSDEDKEAVRFYQRIHNVFTRNGSESQAEKWEAQFQKASPLISQVLDCHNDGWSFLKISEGTDLHKLMKQVENLPKDEWQKLHDDKNHAEMDKIEHALHTILKGDDAKFGEQILSMLKAKAAASSYEESHKFGGRSLALALQQDKGAEKLERLYAMSDAERAHYKANSNGYQQLIDKIIDENASSDLERTAAKRFLSEIKEDKQPDHLDKALLLTIQGNAVAAIKETTAAFNETNDLLHAEPNSESAKSLNILQAALSKSIDHSQPPPHFGRQLCSELFSSGRIPINELLYLVPSAQRIERLKLVNEMASTEEKQRLLNPPKTDKDKYFQDYILGNSEQEKEIARNIIQQGELSTTDLFRAFALGSESKPEELKGLLDKMSAEQKQDLANDYFTKYHTQISKDVLSKVPDIEKYRFIELLSPTDVNPRQVAMDARQEGQKHASIFDGLLSLWSNSELEARETQLNLDKFIKDNATTIDALAPEQRKQFTDAVSNYQAALQKYIDTKGDCAEAFVDSAIMVAAVAGSVFSGGTSLALLAAVGSGGAAFRVAAMKSVQGSDFKGDAENLLRQSFKGASASLLCLIGPEELGLKGMLKLGDACSTQIAGKTVSCLGTEAFKGGREAAEKTLAAGLAQISRQGAVLGDKATAEAVDKLAASILNPAASQTEKDLLKQELMKELKEGVVQGMRNKALSEAETLVSNMMAGVLANSATEIAATGLGLEDPTTLWNRIANSAESAAVGVTFFHVAFKGASSVYKGIIGRDAQGIFAGEGTVIRHADNKITVVERGETYRFKAGDRVVEDLDSVFSSSTPTERYLPASFKRARQPVMEYKVGAGERNTAADPEAVRQSNSLKKNGEVRETLKDGFQSLGGKQEIGPDGTWKDGARPSTVYDRSRDSVLNDTIGKAHRLFDSLKGNPKELIKALAKFAKESMHPNGWSEDMVTDSYMRFRMENQGKRILLGDYIARAQRGEGAGVCQHQALLFKALGDDFGLEVSYVNGVFKTPEEGFGSADNHAWNEVKLNGKSLVVDPRNDVYGVPQEQVPDLLPSRDWKMKGVESDAKLLKQGQELRYQGDDFWKVSSDRPKTPGNFVLSHDIERSCSAAELSSLNGGRKLVIGETYRVNRSNGRVDDGWVLTNIDANGKPLLAKKDGLKIEVSVKDLERENDLQHLADRPRLAQGPVPHNSEQAAMSAAKAESVPEKPADTAAQGEAARRTRQLEILKGSRESTLCANNAYCSANAVKPGEAVQNDIFRVLDARLKKLQTEGKISEDWEVDPTILHGTADNAKADYLMVNRKTGEFHLLDAKSADKAGEEVKNYSQLRQRGVIQYDPRVFDSRPTGAPGEATSVQLTQQFESNVDESLLRLSQTPSPFVLGDTPFPMPGSKPDAATQYKDLLKLQQWCEAQGTPELRAYAAELQGGLTYLSKTASTTISNDVVLNVAELANTYIVDNAISTLTKQSKTIAKAADAPSSVFRTKDAESGTITIGGTNYAFKPLATLTVLSNRLMGREDILSPQQLKQLRSVPTLSKKSDQELTRMVKDQISRTKQQLGRRSGDSPRIIGVDDLLDIVRKTSASRLTRVTKP